MRRGLARRDIRRFPRRLALVAAHVAHLAGKRLVQPAQALVLREQLRSVRGFVKEGIADIRVARIKSAHVVRGAFDLFGREGHGSPDFPAHSRFVQNHPIIPSLAQRSLYLFARRQINPKLLFNLRFQSARLGPRNIRILNAHIGFHHPIAITACAFHVRRKVVSRSQGVQPRLLIAQTGIKYGERTAICSVVHYFRPAIFVYHLAGGFRRKIFVEPLDKSEEICYSKIGSWMRSG